MLKLVSWDLKDESGYHVEVLNGPNATFEKQAAAFEGEYSEDIISAIDKIEKKSGHTYLLINAMGAGEFYGSNKNNDYFPEKVLREYHKTFEALAHVYKHHVNKDPRRSYGKVIYSFYNERMHRVELIVEVVNSKAQDILDRIAAGENVAVSMGCKVPWDECSECGNRAKTRREYCAHLRRGSAGRVTPDGRKPYAINWQPKFFDISFVTIPADPTASVLSKVASKNSITADSVNSEEEMDNLLKISGLKKADIIKRIDGRVEAAASDPKALIPFIQDDMPKDELRAMTDKYSLRDILSTLLSMNIMPKKTDFQRMVLYSSGKHDLADRLDRCGQEFPVDEGVTPIIPADVDPSFMRPSLAREYSHWIPERSLTKPLVIIRVMKKMAELEKQAGPIAPISDPKTPVKEPSKDPVPPTSSESGPQPVAVSPVSDFRTSKELNILYDRFKKAAPAERRVIEKIIEQLLGKQGRQDANASISGKTNQSWTKQGSFTAEFLKTADTGGPTQSDIGYTGGGSEPSVGGFEGLTGTGMQPSNRPNRAALAKLLSSVSEEEKLLLERVLNSIGYSTKTASVRSLSGDTIKIGASEPNPADYEGMSGDAIVTDLSKNYGMGAADIQPWMMSNKLWDSRAVTQYNTLKWTVPWKDYSSWDSALQGDPYAAAKYLLSEKGYTSASDWDQFATAYGYNPIAGSDIDKNLQYITNPPPQNALSPFGLKGYKALKQTSTSQNMAKIIQKVQESVESNRKGLPTRMEEEGKILPSNLRTGPLNKLSSYLAKKAGFEYMDPNMSTPLEEAGLTPARVPDMNPRAPEKNPFFAVTGLGALYLGYKRLMDMGASKNLPKMERTIIQNPWMLPLLAAGTGLGMVQLQKAFNKNAGYVQPGKAFEPGAIKSILAAVVPSYYYSGAQEAKLRRGEQIDNLQDFVRKHPFLTSLGALAAVRGGVRAINKYASVEEIVAEMDSETIDKLYNQIIS